MPGRQLPAEWHKQDAILLTWPHAESDWADQLEDAEAVYLDIVGIISHTQDIVIQIHDSVDLEKLTIQFERESINQARCHFVSVNSDDTWARDHGPITILEQEQEGDDWEPLLLDFTFNGWGGKFDARKDDALNRAMAEKGVFRASMESIDWVLEGGSLESDGAGTLLTTTQCLLNPNRNGIQSRETMESHLKGWFGVRQVLWLEHGALAGDDTDAHIDTLARFAPNNTLVYQGCDKTEDEHYQPLQQMAEELAGFHNADGEPYRLINLPWPDAQYSAEGQRLPATYANFLVANQLVLMPTYGVPQDGPAAERLAEAFPDHRVVAIDCRALIEQFGSLHCVTMQLPEGVLSGKMLDLEG